jgi:hypothetical protein
VDPQITVTAAILMHDPKAKGRLYCQPLMSAPAEAPLAPPDRQFWNRVTIAMCLSRQQRQNCLRLRAAHMHKMQEIIQQRFHINQMLQVRSVHNLLPSSGRTRCCFRAHFPGSYSRTEPSQVAIRKVKHLHCEVRKRALMLLRLLGERGLPCARHEAHVVLQLALWMTLGLLRTKTLTAEAAACCAAQSSLPKLDYSPLAAREHLTALELSDQLQRNLRQEQGLQLELSTTFFSQAQHLVCDPDQTPHPETQPHLNPHRLLVDVPLHLIKEPWHAFTAK